MRLIDADALMEEMCKSLKKGQILHRIPPQAIYFAPTINPEDLRPKSKWEYFTKKMNGIEVPFVRCKRCRKERPFDYGLKYCSNCGAKIEQ